MQDVRRWACSRGALAPASQAWSTAYWLDMQLPQTSGTGAVTGADRGDVLNRPP
jgi:hypothetical protein